MSIPTVNPLPPPPLRTDPGTDFATKAATFLSALPPMRDQMVTLASWLDGRAATTESNAQSAASSSAAAVAAANFKGQWSSLSGALAVPASVAHNGDIWLLLHNVAAVAAHTPGGSSAWAILTSLGVARFTTVSVANHYTAQNRQWVHVTAAGLTITLPPSPALGAEVAVSVGAFTNTTIGRNGQNIMGLAEDMVIDRANRAAPLIFLGGTQGWRIA